MLVLLKNGQIGGKTVKVNGGLNGASDALRLVVPGVLREHGSDDAGEDVSAATLGHAGIARSVDRDRAIRVGNQRSPTLQDDGDRMTSGKVAGDFLPIRLHILDAAAD